MSKPLPEDTDAALAAIADGWGREPTLAHPECRCIAPDRGVTPERRKKCPVHGKAPER